MINIKIYQIRHNVITYFVTLTSPKKSQRRLIIRTGGRNIEPKKIWSLLSNQSITIEHIRPVFLMCNV